MVRYVPIVKRILALQSGRLAWGTYFASHNVQHADADMYVRVRPACVPPSPIHTHAHTPGYASVRA